MDVIVLLICWFFNFVSYLLLKKKKKRKDIVQSSSSSSSSASSSFSSSASFSYSAKYFHKPSFKYDTVSIPISLLMDRLDHKRFQNRTIAVIGGERVEIVRNKTAFPKKKKKKRITHISAPESLRTPMANACCLPSAIIALKSDRCSFHGERVFKLYIEIQMV